MGRATQGVTVMRLRDGDRLSSVALVAEQPDDPEDGELDEVGLEAGSAPAVAPEADADELSSDDLDEDDLGEDDALE
jgi:hypothetical protein